jgi:hypothetical protein
MQSGQSTDEQRKRKQAAIAKAARDFAPKPSDHSGPWTLRRTDRLEMENVRLHVRVDYLEQKVDRLEQKPAESVTPRFPHDGPPPTRDEWRSFLRRVGWNKTADLL